MGHGVVQQPNGLLAVWSTVVDDWVMLDATDSEVIRYETRRGASRDHVELAIERAHGRIEQLPDRDETFEGLNEWRRLQHYRVPCGECGHDEIAHDGGQGVCDRDDEGCECAEFEVPAATGPVEEPVIVCRFDGCVTTVSLPVVNGRAQLAPAIDWTFDSELGWRCPKHAEAAS